MTNADFRYRIVNSATGEEVSSSEGFMTIVTKKGRIAIFDTKHKRMVFSDKFKGLHVEVATHRHNGEWVFDKPKKDTKTLDYKLKQTYYNFIKSI